MTKRSLHDLDNAIIKAQHKHHQQASPPPKGQASLWRCASDMLAPLIVSVFIGIQLDTWLDMKPLFLILFFFLGSAAGFLSLWRTLSRHKP
ncbi:MAG: AtpZ/AtpI family protein [Alphaproteobacteria bacterium GM7ARS4]|nr:AtpZ/AtpI family protein [Alphaproteobacteria bacterium GM7ARS4]